MNSSSGAVVGNRHYVFFDVSEHSANRNWFTKAQNLLFVRSLPILLIFLARRRTAVPISDESVTCVRGQHRREARADSGNFNLNRTMI